MSETEWVQAAAVAAGVEVQVDLGAHTRPTVYETEDEFRANLSVGSRYRLPAGWSPEPPADDEPCATNPCEACRGRAVRATDECTLSPDRVGSPAGNDHPVTIPPADDLRERIRTELLEVMQGYRGFRVSKVAAAPRPVAAWLDENLDDLLALITHSPPPVPPWPGAVLSGLTDEDGEPTWLALAPNVLGEDVRTCVDFPWFICGSDNAVTPYWVEVRAPRAVPEPETERVPWYRAPGRRQPGGDLLGPIVQAYPNPNLPGGMYVEYELPEHGTTTGNPHRDPDGTVEVLKDGGQ